MLEIQKDLSIRSDFGEELTNKLPISNFMLDQNGKKGQDNGVANPDLRKKVCLKMAKMLYE